MCKSLSKARKHLNGECSFNTPDVASIHNPGYANVNAIHHTILVLWGQGFDAIAASIFVGELRRIGKRVKLVDLNPQHRVGRHGLTLVPDLSLGQALRAAKQVRCIIVPAPLAALQQFSYDPRLAELLQRAAKNAPLIAVEALSSADPHPEAYPILRQFQAIAYPLVEELLPFVQQDLVARIDAVGASGVDSRSDTATDSDP